MRVTDHATSRPAAELIELAGRARPARVASLAVRTLALIAETEARLHDTDLDEVHLHDLGGHDTVVDVVGVAAALHELDVDVVYSAPLPLGTGTVRAAHGVLPCPAPATLALLAGAVTVGSDLPGETVTPTAAALVRAIPTEFAPPPAMSPVRTGYGAGHRELADRPNVVSVTVASRSAATPSAVLLETNVDDVTGETVAHVLARVFAAGYRANGRDRCYFRKSTVLTTIIALAGEHGFAAVATGTNAADGADPFRPGIRAGDERGAHTPLRDAGLTKAAVRALSWEWGLSTWDKPATPCLASRIRYGIPVTSHRLARVDRAEQAVRVLLPVTELRVRDLGDSVRVEVDTGHADPAAVADAVHAAGFPAGLPVGDVHPGISTVSAATNG